MFYTILSKIMALLKDIIILGWDQIKVFKKENWGKNLSRKKHSGGRGEGGRPRMISSRTKVMARGENQSILS